MIGALLLLVIVVAAFLVGVTAGARHVANQTPLVLPPKSDRNGLIALAVLLLALLLRGLL